MHRKATYRILLTLLALLMPTLCGWHLAQARPGDKLLNRQFADQKRMHLGFSVGLHFQDLNLTHNGYISPEGQQWVAEVPAFSPGFCVNVLADIRLHRYLNLRLTPGIYFGSKTIRMIDYNSPEHDKDPDTGFPTAADQTVKSCYVVVPLDLKFSGERYFNSRPYVVGGVMAAFTVGPGCDFYLPFFKFIPEIKFCFGLTDILRHNRPDLDENPQMMLMTQSLSKVKSNMVVINFYFE